MINVDAKSEGVRLKERKRKRKWRRERAKRKSPAWFFEVVWIFSAYFLLIQNWLFFRRPFYFRQEFLKRVPEKNVRRPRVVGRWSELDLAHPAEGLSSSLYLPFPLFLSSAPSPLSLSLSLFPQFLPFSFPRTRRKETGKKIESPENGQPRVRLKTPAGSFARPCRVGGRASGSHTLVFFLLVHVHFALVLIFIHGGKNCAAPSNFREIIVAR